MNAHIDEPDCTCGLCEPATLEGSPTLGQILSGNPGCDFPACTIAGTGCMWGNKSCIDHNARPRKASQ